jgi:hypothetical protein
MENNLVHLQELRKSLAANAPSKSVNLFYINLDQVPTARAGHVERYQLQSYRF